MRAGLLVIGSILPMIGVVPYLIDIIRGPVRPQRMTRFLLLVITGLSFVSLLAGHDHSGVWLALASFMESLILWIVSLWRGIGGRGRLDEICLVLCMVGVAWWIVSGESLTGLVISIVADLVASVPSLVKTVRLPHTETPLFYGLGTVAGVCVALAGPYTWRALLLPLYLAIINAAFTGVIVVQPLRSRARPAAADAV